MQMRLAVIVRTLSSGVNLNAINIISSKDAEEERVRVTFIV